MENQITVREAVTAQDAALFWDQLHTYHRRDIFPNPEDEDLAYFLDDAQYKAQIQRLHDREQDRCHYLFFSQNGQDIGLALPVIYKTEDGKCFLMEFCVFPEFRGGGTGKQCARVFLDWAEKNGADYVELNYGGNERRLRFWQSMGFVKNGMDEWGEPLMILPPEGTVPFTVEILSDPEDCQLFKLENSYLAEIAEEPMTEEKQEQLRQAVRDGKITFFIAKRGYRFVGMCSVSKCFSTFASTDTGVFEDFFVEPVFRKKGIARMLAQAAMDWCAENHVASLTVCCAPCDEKMYQALGFDIRLGATFAHIN